MSTAALTLTLPQGATATYCKWFPRCWVSRSIKAHKQMHSYGQLTENQAHDASKAVTQDQACRFIFSQSIHCNHSFDGFLSTSAPPCHCTTQRFLRNPALWLFSQSWASRPCHRHAWKTVPFAASGSECRSVTSKFEIRRILHTAGHLQVLLRAVPWMLGVAWSLIVCII